MLALRGGSLYQSVSQKGEENVLMKWNGETGALREEAGDENEE